MKNAKSIVSTVLLMAGFRKASAAMAPNNMETISHLQVGAQFSNVQCFIAET